MRVEDKELVVAGSSWDLAAPFSPCDINLEEGRGNNNWLMTKGKKEKIFCCSPVCQKKISFT